MTLDKPSLEENKEIKKDIIEQNCPSFSISRYILQLLLPKCAMVHGEVVPSVYFQISVNINHKKNVKKWQEKKCWMGTKTIAKITGYNFRTVHHALQVLEDLSLIEKNYHGKLKMYQLRNENLVEPNEIYGFIKSFEKKLLESLTEEKQEKHSAQFKKLNSKYCLFSPLHVQQLSKKVWFPNINTLRSQLLLAESTYKGSSLFFINMISQDLFKKRHTKTNNKNISEADRSLLLGCSQPTLNRYITAYENADIIKREKNNASYPKKIMLDEAAFVQENPIKRVVDELEDKILICSVCDKEFKTQRALSMHITKSKDDQHIALKENKLKSTPKIQEPKHNIIDKKLEDKYMSIPCECTMSCKSCFKEWKTDFFDDCNHERKAAFIEEYEIDLNKTQVVEKPKKKKVEVKDDSGYEKIPTTRKGPSPDTAPGLVKYFYDLTGGMSPNWSKESKQIKNLLTSKNKPLTPDEVRIVLSHMVRKSHADLRFLGTSVNDALLEQKYIQEMEQEGTAAYLVKKFYSGHSLSVNIQTLIRDVQRIQETINSGLGYEDTNLVIEYMIETKCTTINFIGSKRNEALLIKKNSQQMVKTASKNTNNSIKQNPSFYDQDDLTIFRDELLGGRLHIKKVPVEQKSAVADIAKQIFKENRFNQRFTSFEWAWRVGLILDEEMYNIALNRPTKQTSLQNSMANSSRLSEDKLNILHQLNMKFETWLQKQHDSFGQGMNNLQLEKSDLN